MGKLKFFRGKTKNNAQPRRNSGGDIKSYSIWYIVISVLYLVLGAAMIGWPTSSLRILCYVLGCSMLIVGATCGVIFFTRNSEDNRNLYVNLILGIVCLAFGLFVLVNPSFLDTLLPFAMGIILLLGAVVKIQSAVSMKRLRYQKWWAVLVAALVLIAMAVVLLCNPFKEIHFMILYCGICLIIDGVTNLIAMISVSLRMKSLTKISRQYPGAGLNELLDMHVGSKEDILPAAKDTALEEPFNPQDQPQNFEEGSAPMPPMPPAPTDMPAPPMPPAPAEDTPVPQEPQLSFGQKDDIIDAP